LERGVAAQSLVVVQILLAKGDGDDPLGNHRHLFMDAKDRVSGVRDRLVDGVEEANALTSRSKMALASEVTRPPRKSAITDLGRRLEKVRDSRLHSIIAVASLLEDSDRRNHIS
jgi:hypothetical protein